jgi:DNA-binding IscR family transcriptional regulator
MKNHWINFDKNTGLVHRAVDKIEDTTQKHLQQIKVSPDFDEKIVAELKKRKLVTTTYSTFPLLFSFFFFSLLFPN